MNKLSLLFLTALILAACAGAPVVEHTYFVARVFPTAGNEVTGIITFEQTGEGVRVTGSLEGLSPGKHGFHIHQWGDLSLENGKSTGGHYNPEGSAHGPREAEERHVGDLGNIEADAGGISEFSFVDTRIALGGPQSILGRSVIIHEKEDDYTQPAGNAGSRIGYGVIGLGEKR